MARELCKHVRLGPGPREALLDAGVEDEGGDDALFHHAALHAVHLDGIKVDGDGVEDVFRERVPAAVLVLSVEAEQLGVGCLFLLFGRLTGVRAVHVWLKPARLGADDAETSPEGAGGEDVLDVRRLEDFLADRALVLHLRDLEGVAALGADVAQVGQAGFVR